MANDQTNGNRTVARRAGMIALSAVGVLVILRASFRGALAA